MKEPKRYNEKKYYDKDLDAKRTHFYEQHYCPVCNKPTVKYLISRDGDDEFVDDIDSKDAILYLESPKIIIQFFANGPAEDEERAITLKEISLKKFADKFEKDYCKKYKTSKDKRTPYFCSKKCIKKFILNCSATIRAQGKK